MRDQYVLLTGSMNNAGDFLIKHRAAELLAKYRPDRLILHADRWRSIDDELLAAINASRAVVLAGGPALRRSMYPEIYPLRKTLDDITVPIVTFGIGWKDKRGRWEDSRNYAFTERSLALLRKIETSGFLSSVRDYHSLNVLKRHGFNRFLMTGCPALYGPIRRGASYEPGFRPEKISFSLGVSFLESRAMERQMRCAILSVKERFPQGRMTVVFHHAIQGGLNVGREAVAGNRRFADWLEAEAIPYIDVSGSAEAMMEHYGACDLHVGYRVHAHVFMCSMGKPSLLVAEDGRGKALRQVLGASVLNAFDDVPPKSLLRKLRTQDPYQVSPHVPEEIAEFLEYELDNGMPRLMQSNSLIDGHFHVMKKFLAQLP